VRRRILVVDDEPAMGRSVGRVLEARHDVTVAGSGEEALAAAARSEPDLAILDVRMPGIDGFELLARLRERQPAVDVILMTGSVGEIDQKLVRAIRDRAFYFLQKPFDREVLRTLVERCFELRGLAEENRRHVQRLEGVLAEARAFQAGLLPPREACFGGVSLGARHVPCDELGGDLYDYDAWDRDGVAFVIADVSGHGASAAMLTGVVKSAFRSCAGAHYEPLAVVERIHVGLRSFGDHRFVTLICGRIDGRAPVLEWVNAGHPGGLLWRDGQPLATLDATGPLVSPALDGLTWRQERTDLSRAGRLLLYTDGVSEAPGAEGFFGVERLRQVAEAAGASAAAPADAVLHAVAEHLAGRPPEDDLTLLAVGWGAAR